MTSKGTCGRGAGQWEGFVLLWETYSSVVWFTVHLSPTLAKSVQNLLCHHSQSPYQLCVPAVCVCVRVCFYPSVSVGELQRPLA